MKYRKNVDEVWKTFIVPDEWPEEVKQAQIQMLLDEGWKPVFDAVRPADTPFIEWNAEYTELPDRFTVEWKPVYRVIYLDRGKLLAAISQIGKLQDAMNLFQNDQLAAMWWTSQLCYVKASPMAVRIQTALELTEPEIEELVLACRE